MTFNVSITYWVINIIHNTLQDFKRGIKQFTNCWLHILRRTLEEILYYVTIQFAITFNYSSFVIMFYKFYN
jgi:hypothetical protein